MKEKQHNKNGESKHVARKAEDFLAVAIFVHLLRGLPDGVLGIYSVGLWVCTEIVGLVEILTEVL